jgi:tetratricopeptide (TPR) repeat protein
MERMRMDPRPEPKGAIVKVSFRCMLLIGLAAALFAAPGWTEEAPQAAFKSPDEPVEQGIRREVRRLEYSDSVAERLVTMVRDWKLGAEAGKLAAAAEEHQSGKLSQDQLAAAQRATAGVLCREIAAVVRGKDDVRELDQVIRSKRACCVGYALLFHVLGRAVGLDVQGLEVPAIARGRTVDARGHLADVVHLADGRAAIADATGSLGHNCLVSKSFRFAEAYCRRGTYWELKDAGNPLGLHRLVQPLDTDGLVAEILLCRAIVLRDKGETERAQSLVSEALRRNPNTGWGYEIQGWIHEESGEHDSAIADFSTAIQHDSAYESAYLNRSRSFAAKGQVDLALADLDEAIRLNPKFAAAYFARGWVRQRQADLDAWNLSATNQAPAAAPPSQPAGYLSGGGCLAGVNAAYLVWTDPPTGTPAEIYVPAGTVASAGTVVAMGPYASATVRGATTGFSWPSPPNPEELEAIRARAGSYCIKRGQEQALPDYAEAIRLDPNNSTYHVVRAEIYEAWGDNKNFIADLSGAIRAAPKDAVVRNRRSRAYEAAGDLDRAVADMAEVIHLDPLSPEHYARRADLNTRKHDFDAAIADLSEVILLKEKPVVACERRAELYGRKGEVEKAIADMTEVIRMDPKCRAAYERRAELYSRKHDNERAALDTIRAAQLPRRQDRG